MYEKKGRVGSGYRVGKLTVMEGTDKRRQGYTVWRCRCDCGGEILLDTRYLQRGTVCDCGCGRGIKTRRKDLTGMRFGRLVCLDSTEERGTDGGVIWRCQCDCGRETLAVSTQLLNGNKKSCGCLVHPPLKDWIGKRFGTLEVVSYGGKKNGSHYWHCRCLCGCGRELDVRQSSLQNGHTKGCRALDRNRMKSYIGRHFGRLTVVEYAGMRDGNHFWLCRCACGNQIEVSQNNLQSSHTKSCGCLQKIVYRENLKLAGGTSVAMLESRMKGGVIASNTSGYNGVYRNKRSGKWTAQITFKGKTYYLGSYADIKEAVKARSKGEEMYADFLTWYYAERKQEEKKRK